MKGIKIHVEGGGDSTDQKSALRRGLDRLLIGQKNDATSKRMSWKVVFCGSRNDAHARFAGALRDPRNQSLTILLVDSENLSPSETENAETRVRHLNNRDGWNLDLGDAECVHLMVQCMESWIVADLGALKGYYGQGFQENKIPRSANLEAESKQKISDGLKAATCKTQKGEYHKIKHAANLLAKINPDVVGQRCPHFKTFANWLSEQIADAGIFKR